jgi:hypothetical protein
MRSRRPDLVVPIRDRRQHVRILTLKNFGKAVLAVVVLLVAANFVSEIRQPHNGLYGRLFGQQVAQPPVAAPKLAVITEAPVEDRDTADPLLIAPAAREQYLGPRELKTAPAAVVPVNDDRFEPRRPLLSTNHEHVSIVGDAGGVSVVSGPASGERHTLTGGIFANGR